METEVREEKVISEGHLARDPKSRKKKEGGGSTKLFPVNGKKRCHIAQQKQTTKKDKCKRKYTNTQQLLHHIDAQST